ncbi:carboxypeptidase B-like [Planococcus citri]|uniref:carboxypeptidase B-like n=1 Tax=Planococcus citri TaxID=170843 RepID=UPI0031F8DE4F
MFRLFFTSVVLVLSFTLANGENCYYSRGMVTNFIKFLDNIFDFMFETFFGLAEKYSDEDDLPQKVSYDGFQLLKVWPRTDEDVDDIKVFGEQPRVQIWLPVLKNASTDLIIPPDALPTIKEDLKERGVEFSVINHNIEQVIADQRVDLNASEIQRPKDNKGTKFTWTRYHSYDEILDYMDYLQMTFPNYVKIITIGKSFEGRDLKVIRISSGRFSDGSAKPAAWIDGGMRAREWISIVVALFVARQLTENYKVNQNLVADMDWYILPVVNPDGYVYSYTKDRLWKKSRSINSELANRYFWREEEDEECKGVDLGRNWDFRWNEDSSSYNPCHDTYAGPTPFSEPETRAMSNFLKQHSKEIILYLSLHSYSQTWLIPWTSNNMKSHEYADLLFMGRKAIEALQKSHGITYDLISKNDNANTESGSFSDDWAKNKLGIKYSYTAELRDKGTYGYLLPASQILPTGKEMFTAIKTLSRSILSNTVNKNAKY